MADPGPEPPLGVPGEELGEAVGHDLLAKAKVAAPVEADHGRVLDQQMVRRNLRNLPGGEADREDPRLRTAGAQRRPERIAADRIKDHVHAAKGLARFADVVGLRVDQMIRARLARCRELGLARGAGDHARAHELADLDGGEADAAGGAENQQRLARLQAGAALEGDMAGAVSNLQRRRVFERDALGQFHGAGRGEAAELGEAAMAAEHRHPRARRRRVGVWPEGLNCARGFHPKGEGRRRRVLIFAADHEQIGEVERAGADSDENLAHSRFRRVDLAQRRRRAVAICLKRLHRSLPPASPAPKRGRGRCQTRAA